MRGCEVYTRKFIAEQESDKYKSKGFKTLILPNSGNVEYWVVFFWRS